MTKRERWKEEKGQWVRKEGEMMMKWNEISNPDKSGSIMKEKKKPDSIR